MKTLILILATLTTANADWETRRTISKKGSSKKEIQARNKINGVWIAEGTITARKWQSGYRGILRDNDGKTTPIIFAAKYAELIGKKTSVQLKRTKNGNLITKVIRKY